MVEKQITKLKLEARRTSEVERMVFVVFAILFSCTVFSAFFLLNSRSEASAETTQSATASVNVPSTCTLTSSGEGSHTANVVPGVFTGDIGITTINATCNDPEGYALYAIGYSNTTFGNTNLIHSTDTSTTIPTGTGTTGSNWSMKLAAGTGTETTDIVETYRDYANVPSSYTKVVNKNSATTPTTGSTVTTTYGTYVTINQKPGTYNGKVKYIMVNPSTADTPIIYNINYNKNTEDEVTNMPTPNPEAGDSTTEIATINSSVPVREGYNFKGWCSVATSDGTCSGTVYNPDGGGTNLNIILDPAGTNNFTLHAMWRAPVPLYDAVANLVKKDGSGNPRTQSVTDLQTTITQPTSTDPSTDTSNSGVYKYDPSVFGASSDASNDHDIYYYRGILDTSGHTGEYGSDGQADAYPNYVKLAGSNICWRIVRTTGSGGVKMIYNGTWTGSTCAKKQNHAQVTTRDFDTTADSNGQSIVGVGYTYNATYKSTTSDTQAGTLFGTNSNYTGNTTDSTIKNYIENTWYTSNMSSYANLLEPSAGYCGDRSVNSGTSWTDYDDTTSITTPYTSGSSATTFYFGARMRNTSNAQKSSLGCPRNIVDLYTTADATNGNKQLGKPVSLITADEASFAGSGCGGTCISVYHSNSFLRSGSDFWLLSPGYRYSNGRASVFTLYSYGYLGYGVVHYTYGVRPAISLTPGVSISSGSGISTDPWIVE